MIQLIENNIDQIRRLFQFHQIERAYVFGSALTPDFNNTSDLDFLIKFRSGLNPLEKGEHWWNLHDKLRELFNREIDIVTENSLKNPYFIDELEKTKVLIYGEQD